MAFGKLNVCPMRTNEKRHCVIVLSLFSHLLSQISLNFCVVWEKEKDLADLVSPTFENMR